MGLTCSVLGASGYSGGELLRLLSGHPALSVEGVAAGTRAGSPVADVLPHVRSVGTFAPISEVAPLETDVCISCLPGGVLQAEEVAARILIDLAGDHRWEEGWLYGLAEFARSEVPGAGRVANPGCYPTASLLALLPFARAGLLASPVVIDAISGVSGAGREARDGLLYAGLEGSVSAYGDTRHRHVPEIEEGLRYWGESDVKVSFTPHLAPMTRGLLVTARSPLEAALGDEDALSILKDAYEEEPFVTVVENWPQTKAVAGSNHALVHARVDARAGFLIVSAAIDNLGKGAAGQAIQNANLALGIDEDAGLGALGVWP